MKLKVSRSEGECRVDRSLHWSSIGAVSSKVSSQWLNAWSVGPLWEQVAARNQSKDLKVDGEGYSHLTNTHPRAVEASPVHPLR